jgi:hypothetical protein
MELHQDVASRNRVFRSDRRLEANCDASDLRRESAESRLELTFDMGVQIRRDLDVVSVNHEPHLPALISSWSDWSVSSPARAVAAKHGSSCVLHFLRPTEDVRRDL